MKPALHTLSAILFCAAILAGYGVWYAAVEEKSARMAHLEDQIILKTEATNRIASARASLANIESDEAVIKNYFVPETGVVAFITSLETQAEELKTSLDVLSVSMSNEDTQPTLVLTVAIEGAFDAVMRTVGAIEFSPYALSMSTFSLKQNAKGGWRADANLLVGSVPAPPSTRTP